MSEAGKRIGPAIAACDGELVAVLEDDQRNRIFWYQNPGVFRKLEGVQVFLDPRFRTRCVVGPEAALGLAKVPPPDMR